MYPKFTKFDMRNMTLSDNIWRAVAQNYTLKYYLIIFQGIVLLQILITIKFLFQRYKIWLVLQVKNLTRINFWRRESRDLKLWLPQYLNQSLKGNNYTKAFNTFYNIVNFFYHYIPHYLCLFLIWKAENPKTVCFFNLKVKVSFKHP